MKIESVQPEVVENEKGLMIDFRLSDYSLDAAALNGAAAIIAGGRAKTLDEALARAFLSIDSGAAYGKLAAMVAHAKNFREDGNGHS